MPRYKSKWIGLLVLVAVMATVPFFVGRYFVDVMTLLFINIIVIASFRLITTTGGWNLAHIPLMGLGAYTSTILAKNFGIPFYGTMPVAILAVALVAMLFSFPLRRTRGFAYFIASFAAGEAMRLTWSRIIFPFGGHRGLVNIPPPDFTPIPGLQTINFAKSTPYYLLTLGVMVVCVLIMYRIDISRIGRTFKAVYAEDVLARSVGMDIAKYKTLAYVIGAMFAAVAGVLYAHYMRAIDPAAFGFGLTLYLLVWAIFGGVHSFGGVIAGVSVLTVVQRVLEFVLHLPEWIPLVYGTLLIVTLLFLPGGLESVPKRMRPLVEKMRTLIGRKG